MHQNLMFKKLNSAKETNEIVVTDSDFLLTERTCSIVINADACFKNARAVEFKGEYKKMNSLGNRDLA